MTKQEQLEVISESHINGQYRQMVEQIDRYSPAMFFQDYLEYIKRIGLPEYVILKYFTNIVIAYFTVKQV